MRGAAAIWCVAAAARAGDAAATTRGDDATAATGTDDDSYDSAGRAARFADACAATDFHELVRLPQKRFVHLMDFSAGVGGGDGATPCWIRRALRLDATRRCARWYWPPRRNLPLSHDPSSPRNIHVVAAASPRPVSMDTQVTSPVLPGTLVCGTSDE